VAVQAVALAITDVDIRFAENHKQLALAGIFQVFGHVQVGVHTCFKYRQRADARDITGCAFKVVAFGAQAAPRSRG